MSLIPCALGQQIIIPFILLNDTGTPTDAEALPTVSLLVVKTVVTSVTFNVSVAKLTGAGNYRVLIDTSNQSATNDLEGNVFAVKVSASVKAQPADATGTPTSGFLGFVEMKEAWQGLRFVTGMGGDDRAGGGFCTGYGGINWTYRAMTITASENIQNNDLVWSSAVFTNNSTIVLTEINGAYTVLLAASLPGNVVSIRSSVAGAETLTHRVITGATFADVAGGNTTLTLGLNAGVYLNAPIPAIAECAIGGQKATRTACVSAYAQVDLGEVDSGGGSGGVFISEVGSVQDRTGFSLSPAAVTAVGTAMKAAMVTGSVQSVTNAVTLPPGGYGLTTTQDANLASVTAILGAKSNGNSVKNLDGTITSTVSLANGKVATSVYDTNGAVKSVVIA